jgi:plastocyanin
MRHPKPFLSSLLVALGMAHLALPVRAEDKGERATDGPPSRAEFNKLQTDVREQRQLIIQMLQTEQQRYDMLLHLLQGQGGGTPLVGVPGTPEPGEAPASGDSGDSGDKPAKKSPAVAAVDHRVGAIEGKVTVNGGGIDNVYVYVENVKSPLAHHKSLEIRQENRQFSPRVAVVQSGTSVVFPNFDAIYHNVFSNSPRNSFDLGTYQSGDKPRTVTLTGPGVVDVFCNIHQKMSAKILVVPSVLYTKVRPDGTFVIENVPAGQRRLVAWSPETKPQQQRVAVSGPKTEVTFSLQHEEPAAHPNKLGQAYGSYKD